LSIVKHNVTNRAAIEANKLAFYSLREKNKDGGGSAIVPTRIGLPYYRSTPCNMQQETASSVAPDWTLFKPAVYYPSGLPIVKESTQEDQTSSDCLETFGAECNNDIGNDENEDVLMGVKVVSVRGENPIRYGKPTVPATIMMLNADTGEVNAILSATYLTAARTAAGSAIATRLCLSASGINSLVVFGAGLQAQEHIVAMTCIFDNIENITVINRSRERAEKLTSYLPQLIPRTQISFILQSNTKEVEHAVRSANVIVTATNSSTPLFQGNWVTSGCHINGVGSYTSEMKEVDKELVDRCQVVYDTVEALSVGDLKHLLERKNINRNNQSHHFLLGDIMAQPEILLQDRAITENHTTRPADCTFYKSVGTAIQDICSASKCVQNAKQLGLGTFVDL